MKNIIYILILIFSFSSCVKEKDLFIPTYADYPTNSLKYMIPSKSMDVRLDNNESYKLSTPFNSYIEIDEGAFVPKVEASSDYNLKVIELRDYVDYILQNVDHESNIGITNTIFSFYVSAEQEGSQLDFEEGKTVRIRFPHENVQGELALGSGDIDGNSLRWDYFSSNVNSRVSYIAWETIREDGSMITEYGYEVIIDSPGWYSLVTKESVPNNTSSICLEFSKEYNIDNTAVYILMNDRNYISKLKMINDNSSTFCLGNLPQTTTVPYTVVSISKTDDNSYHYFETEVEIKEGANEIIVDPVPFNFKELKQALQKL